MTISLNRPLRGQRRAFAFILGCIASSIACSEPLKGAVYSPYPGVVCDRKAQFCADFEGISLGLTKLYLGDKAEARMLARVREAGGPAGYDLSWFGFSNGVDCKAKEKVCHVSRHSTKVDAAHTKALFGGKT